MQGGLTQGEVGGAGLSNDRNSPASFDRKPIIPIVLFSQAGFLETDLSDSVSVL